MSRLLLYIWQLPQNLLGLLLIALYKPQRKHILENGVEIHYSHKMNGGISLGKYCLVNTCHYRILVDNTLKRKTVRHEAIGHTKQSRMLGWLYLIIIGLPSIVCAGLYRSVMKKNEDDYFKFYTERWADKIAGIKR